MKKTKIPVALNSQGNATLAQALKKVIEEYDINHSHSAWISDVESELDRYHEDYGLIFEVSGDYTKNGNPYLVHLDDCHFIFQDVEIDD